MFKTIKIKNLSNFKNSPNLEPNFWALVYEYVMHYWLLSMAQSGHISPGHNGSNPMLAEYSIALSNTYSLIIKSEPNILQSMLELCPSLIPRVFNHVHQLGLVFNKPSIIRTTSVIVARCDRV